MLVGLGLWATPLRAGQLGRPAVDVSAMREAMAASRTDDSYPAAAAYAHYLRARLANHDGDQRRALDEYHLALASDASSAFLMTELSEQYARMSDLDHAERQLKTIVEKYPSYAPGQLLMGRVLFEAHKTTRARSHLARAMRLRPADPDAYLVMIQMSLDEGSIEDAVSMADRLGEALPGEPTGYRRLGLALAERGDSQNSERLLRLAVERDPGDLESWATLARIHDANGRPDAALGAWEKALDRDPENREVLLAIGRLSLRLERHADAKAYFDQLLSIGREPETAVKVAFSYMSVHRLAEAAAVLDQARSTSGEARLHFYSGLVHERNRSYGKAVAAFADVPTEAGELFLEAQLHHGMCLSAAGSHGEALSVFRKLSEDRTDLAGLDAAWARAYERAGRTKEAEALLLRAFASGHSSETVDAITAFYDRQGRLDDALSLYNTGLGRTPDDETLLFATAVVLDKRGDWKQSLARMKSVLALNPKNTAAMNFIGYTLAERGGDLHEAEQFVRRALEVKPDSAAFLDSMGWVMLKKGEVDRAIEFLEKAVTEAPDEPTLFEHLGDACVKSGKKPRAQEAWSRALRLLAENPDAGERVTQRVDIEKKLRLLAPASARRR
jgi:tetratricopeptide (TPR) repeat protein